MPRRRPTHRSAPKSKLPLPASSSKAYPKKQHVTSARAQSKVNESENELIQTDDYDEMAAEDAGGSESDNKQGHEDVDVDVPCLSQWEADEFEFDGPFEDESEDDKEKAPNLASLKKDLSSLPLGTLRKAQQMLSYATEINDPEGDIEGASEDEPEIHDIDPKHKGKEKFEWSTKRRTDLAKRSSKHAPQEVTSKRPVTRKRTVVELKAQKSRDPRFLPVVGEFSDRKFQEQYGFLADIHTTELKTLRENVKRARKLLASSPRDLREERQQELARLELAMKRTESSVNKDRQETVEQIALSRVAKEERDKRKQGKSGWWMKEFDKKNLLVRARYDALAATGGKGAVKKAIEKKQKKISQKEKKSRPFTREPGGGDGQQSSPGKRPFSSISRPEGGQIKKRRRVG